MSLTVVRRRGRTPESTHTVSVAIADDTGAMVASAGNPTRVTLARSAAKPFQAVSLIEDGVVERFAMTDQELALACASHSSERRQVRMVDMLLHRMGFEESDLVCGPHEALAKSFAVPPIGEADPEDVRPAPPSRLASNCSGKHTGMLGLARVHGWEPTNYHAIGHPVQDRAKGVFATFTDVPTDDIVEAVDGCGVAAFGVPLDRLAFAFARLGTGHGDAANRIVHAMTRCPEFVAGERRSCTEVMREFPGQVIAKVGAEGVYGAALPEKGLGLALKVEDGNAKAAMVALISVLDALGFEASSRQRIAPFARMPITNTRGEGVGVIEPHGELAFV